MQERKAGEPMQEGISSGDRPAETKANGSQGTRNAQGLQGAMEMLLESYGVPREQSIAWLGNSGLDTLKSKATSGYSRASGNDTSSAGAMLSENARIILAQRYLMKGDDGEPVEDPDGLFHRVSNAVAQGEKPEVRQIWAGRYHDLMTSLKFLPNSPTLVNAGTGGRGCLSACFVVSPEDNMTSIMQVATDAAMIEKWGGGIGFGFSRLRPKSDRIATTHGEACGPIAVMKLYSSVGATLTQGAFRLGAHMGQLNISHPDIQEFIHCKDNDDTLANFNISVQITDDFMRAVDNDKNWTFYNPRDTGGGPVNESAGTVRARDLWREICESAWKTGDPGVVFMDRVWDTQPNPQMGDIQTSNPCVTGDTLVYSGDGLVPISELVGKTPALSLDSRAGAEGSFAIKVWQSGVKPVYRLVTREGYTLKLTADHEIFTTRGKVATSELKRGDRIRLLDHKGYFGSLGDRNLGLTLGWLTGDGHIDVKRAVLSFYGEDHKVGPDTRRGYTVGGSGHGAASDQSLSHRHAHYERRTRHRAVNALAGCGQRLRPHRKRLALCARCGLSRDGGYAARLPASPIWR